MCPPFGEELLIRLTVCSLCIFILCVSHIRFEGGTVVLIALHYVNVSVRIKFPQKTSVFTLIIISSP